MPLKKQRASTFSSWIRAYGLFAGGMIGVGIFGLPAALMAAGLVPFLLELLVVAAVAWGLHAAYAHVVAVTPGRHRFPGYARRYLGTVGAAVGTTVHALGLLGALVAYLIAGSRFLQLLVSPVVSLSDLAALALYAAPAVLLLLGRLRSLPLVELVILMLFLLLLLGLPFLVFPQLSLVNIPFFKSGSEILLPYGVLLFSLWGMSLIPDTREVAGSARRTRSVLGAGIFTAAVAYLIFALSVTGVTGQFTTEDALSGMSLMVGDHVVSFALLFGVLTTFSSYLALGLVLRQTLVVDARFPRPVAFAFTVGVPLAIVVLGARNLISVLSLTGAVFLGIEGLLVLWMLWRVCNRRRGTGPDFSGGGLAGVGILLLFGVASALVRVLIP